MLIPLEHPLVTSPGHPVDIVRGHLRLRACDLELPGALPLRLERHYSTEWIDRDSPLGRGWSHSLDEAVWLEPDRLVYRAEDGRRLELPIADDRHLPAHRLHLRRLGDQRWRLTDHHGVAHEFAPIAGDPRPELCRLITRRDRAGHTLECHYDERAELTRVHADGDREIHLHHSDTRLTRIDLPDPDGPGFLPHVRYVHDHDDLLEIHDAIGQVTRHHHHAHRITERTLPGGPRFHCEYDPQGACVHTWGDGGVLDRRFIRDRPRRTTIVVDACGETTCYRADERDLIVERTDPRGAVTRFAYDDLHRLIERTDALGHLTRRTFDARGNCTRHEAPDGAVTVTTYHPQHDLPDERIDPTGARWRWSHDLQARLLRTTDPLGRTTVHHHDLSPGTGITIETVVHPDGRSEQRHRDAAGRLVRHSFSDGTTRAHHHDRRGRLRRTVDERGRSETRDYDLLGRLTRHSLPDGELRLHAHDARGRRIRSSDARGDLRCSHAGPGWLVSCGDASAPPITLERDLEGRIIRVAGPTGTLLRIERDAAGQVCATVDALGVRRRHTRDLLGRIVQLHHPDGQRTDYTRDPAGRVLAIDHGDGTRDEFTYRLDGALQSATRRHPDARVTAVRRELDVLGRPVRERQGDHAIALEYDLRDRLVRLRSSLGADLRFIHDDRGLARVELPRETWSLGFQRDRHGREQLRHLPGEVLSWWHHDHLGRPVEHGLVAGRPPQIHRHRRYHWTGEHPRVEEIARRRGPTPAPTPSVREFDLDPGARRITSHLSDGTAWSYRWSGSGDLLTATAGDLHITYRHDALGRRVARLRGHVETHWLFHHDLPLHSWTDHDTRNATTWIFEPTTRAPLARLTPDRRLAIVGDHQGTPLAMFDERGRLAWSAELDEHGHSTPIRGDPDLCPFRRAHRLRDPDTGLEHAHLRDYDPTTRLHLAPHPLGLLGALDLHADPPAADRVHARIVAELLPDFPPHDLPPALTELTHPDLPPALTELTHHDRPPALTELTHSDLPRAA